MPDGTPRRRLVGLVGSGIGPSLSPPLHEREAAELGLDYVYRRLDLDELGYPPDAAGDLVAQARAAGYDGLNVTHPCKQLVVAHLDTLADDAATLGAVNTVVFTAGGAVGHNTDRSGFTRAFACGLPGAALERVVLFGAGGAGAAVAHGLLALGTARLDVFDADEGRAADLATSLGRRFGVGRALCRSLAGGSGYLADALGAADGLVHATPTGMAEHPGVPIPIDLLRPELWVADVVYRPLDTGLVVAARGVGCRVLDGGRMAVFQAADAFELFTGVRPDTDRMLRHFGALVAPAAK